MKAVLERILGKDGLPYELLLLADPSRDIIERPRARLYQKYG